MHCAQVLNPPIFHCTQQSLQALGVPFKAPGMLCPSSELVFQPTGIPGMQQGVRTKAQAPGQELGKTKNDRWLRAAKQSMRGVMRALLHLVYMKIVPLAKAASHRKIWSWGGTEGAASPQLGQQHRGLPGTAGLIRQHMGGGPQATENYSEILPTCLTNLEHVPSSALPQCCFAWRY